MIGVNNKNFANAINKSDDSKINPTYSAPIKVLPTSPINIFAGGQFQIKNPKQAPIIGKVDKSPINTNVRNTNDTQEANKPSRPSIKLQKFIIPVAKIIRITKEIKYKKPEKFNEINSWKELKYIKNKTVIICEIYLVKGEMLLISSKNPIKASGKHNIAV